MNRQIDAMVRAAEHLCKSRADVEAFARAQAGFKSVDGFVVAAELSRDQKRTLMDRLNALKERLP